MRRVIYIPIIHASADLGSLAGEVAKRGLAGLGEDLWKNYRLSVEGFWKSIETYFNNIDVAGVKIYQDGMVAEGEIGGKIVEEGVKSGSKNYEIIAKLLKRGAVLVKTEDFNLVKEERDRLVALTQTKSTLKKLAAFVKYKLIKDRLLKKRDEFIASRIAETLKESEKGVLFLGAYHRIKEKLPKDILTTEVKDVEKVREYHRLLPYYRKNKDRFEELGRYLTSSVSL